MTNTRASCSAFSARIFFRDVHRHADGTLVGNSKNIKLNPDHLAVFTLQPFRQLVMLALTALQLLQENPVGLAISGGSISSGVSFLSSSSLYPTIVRKVAFVATKCCVLPRTVMPMKGFATTASHRALFACSSCSSRTKSLLESRREAFRLRLFGALLFLLTVLFDIAAEDPTRQSISICPSTLDLTQNAILGKFLYRWSTGSSFASNRKYLIGANAECQRCLTADAASSGRSGPPPASSLDSPRAGRTS